MSTVMACVLKNVIRLTSPGGYNDGCLKMTKTDSYICSHVYIRYTWSEVYCCRANL